MERDDAGAYHLTQLGRLAGQSATEVRSIIRLVDCLRRVQPEEISDPALITAAQVTAELDDVLFPINKKSTQKEPQVWHYELRRLGVPGVLLNVLQMNAIDSHQLTLRAKKAVACLLFVSGKPMSEIEATMTQFGGAFGGAAGPIRAAASRTSDLLPVTARVAEILHPALELGDRIGRLTMRLTYGVSAACVDLAREAGAEFLRGDYRRLEDADLLEPDRVAVAEDSELLQCLDHDQVKVATLRAAAHSVGELRRQAGKVASPILEPYVA